MHTRSDSLQADTAVSTTPQAITSRVMARLSRSSTAIMAAAAAVMAPTQAGAQNIDTSAPAPASSGEGDAPGTVLAPPRDVQTSPTTGNITITVQPPASQPFNTVAPRDPSQPLMAQVQVQIDAPRWANDARFAELVLDATTGEIVYQRNGVDTRHVASMTKVMTAYMVFQAIESGRLSRDTMLTASPAAANVLRRTMRLGVRAGDQLSVDEALHALISMSAGDAAIMLAEAVSGSEAAFAQEMTQTAHRFGAIRSTFGTASGITGDESTAYDIALIFSQVSRDFPDLYADYFSPPTVTLRNQEQPNCRLCADESGLADIGATGQKTGTRGVSGSSIVVQIENGDRRYIVVAMGAPSSSARMERAVELARAVWNSPLPSRQQLYMASVAPPAAVAN